MKNTLRAVFVTALVLLPAWGAARTYEAPYLSCVSNYPMVSVGNTGRFHVVTNVQGPFMWVAGDEDYAVYDAGAEFVTPFKHTGRQQVTVVWGSKRANCYVDVVPTPGFGEPNPAPYYGEYGPNVTLSSVLYPRLPNAGFEPRTLAAVALAFVLLLGAAIALYQHVKYAFAVVTR